MNSSTRTRMVAMITMAAGKPPRTGVDSHIDRLGPSGTQTFYTQVGLHARSFSPLRGWTKACTIPMMSPDICNIRVNMGSGTFRGCLATKQRKTVLGWTSTLGGSHPREKTSSHSGFHGMMGHGNAYQKALCPSLTFIGHRPVQAAV
jgi:hypothetical protein